MIEEIIRFSSFLLPIPFILLFFVKTNKLNFLKNYGISFVFIPIFILLMFGEPGYNLELVIAYITFVLVGATILSQRNWTYPQALSISFCLVYFGSFLWELPTHIYTTIIRGGPDGSLPLTLLFIFPMIFIYQFTKTNRPKREILDITLATFLFSTFVLLTLLSNHIDVWNVQNNTIPNQRFEETLWMFNRIVAMFGLFALYIKSTPRQKHKKENELK